MFAAQGLRISSNPGHHRVALEGLAAELSLSITMYDEIQLLLDLRNTKYTGLLQVNPADMRLALELLERILSEVHLWFSKNKPEMLKPS